jgi:hypothetical protein
MSVEKHTTKHEMITLMMEAVRASETSVYSNETTRSLEISLLKMYIKHGTPTIMYA